MYPTNNNVYLPILDVKSRPITIDEVKQYGRIVCISEDETRATVEVKIGLTINYCGVLLNEDGSVKDFIPKDKKYSKFVKAGTVIDYSSQENNDRCSLEIPIPSRFKCRSCNKIVESLSEMNYIEQDSRARCSHDFEPID